MEPVEVLAAVAAHQHWQGLLDDTPRPAEVTSATPPLSPPPPTTASPLLGPPAPATGTDPRATFELRTINR